MKILVVALVFSGALSLCSAGGNVLCYVQEWRTVTSYNYGLCTHAILAFIGLDSSGNVIDANAGGPAAWTAFTGLKSKYPSTKFLVALGGANSAGLSTTIKNTMVVSVNNLYNFIIQYKFDGLDIDWEFPTSSDKVSYISFLSSLRSKFGSKYLLTVATSGDISKIGTVYDVPNMNKYLDFFNLMTYDFHGSWESYVQCNSPLSGSGQWTTSAVVSAWINAGASSGKVILGIPFYANEYTLSSSPNHGLNAGAAFKTQLAYPSICGKLKTYTTVIDPTQQCAYAYSGTDWLSIENQQSIKLKCNYAVSKNLGGVMMWELGQDDNTNSCGQGAYPLMTAINSVIRPSVG